MVSRFIVTYQDWALPEPRFVARAAGNRKPPRMARTLDLKSTLNLPRTAFPMKASLPEMEPRQLEEWNRMEIYGRVLEARAGSPVYLLHDGPPYPTGDIHLGQGLNKSLKDMVVKSKAMAGFRAPYVPGWDCHGLPIEVKVEKELGGKKGKVSIPQFRKMCREFAARYVEAHKRDFRRLGVFGDWDHPYLTMDNAYEARIAEAFLVFLEKGYVYRGRKPVYWCLHDHTALAEAEVEYEDHTSPSIWVRYEAVEVPGVPRRAGGKLYAIIWTTTPWTLPASLALAFHPRFDYAVVEDDRGDAYLVAAELTEKVAGETGLKFVRRAESFHGARFERARFRHPFLDREVLGVLAEYVTLEQGSGIVHTAPGHGAEDFYTGQKYGLETYAPLDDAGKFTEGLPAYRGKTVFEANPAIVELLRERGALLAVGTLAHSYPHCWRCHNPVIFRATEQWFVDLEHHDLRRRAREEIGKVEWIPAWGRERMDAMIATRPDWCVSRQRVWGVPLIIFYCDACGEQLRDFAALRHVLGWFEREGADAWFAREPAELLPPGTRCPCGAARWRKESDILDVWFDSGSSHLAVLDGRDRDHRWPADLYLEGPDQYRGWFHSSLLIGLGVKDAAPYRVVLSHGWTLDAEGRPMSKSLGNVLSPREICDRWGADLLRLWVASQDYHADLRMSEQAMAQLGEAYRKLRNTFRFALGNLNDFSPERDALPPEKLWELDRWMLERTAWLVGDCRAWYEQFEFHRVFHAVHDFAVVDLSAFYFDVLKDRLYTFAPASPGRRSAQTAVHRIAHALVRLLAPILVFTAEEVWKHLPRPPAEPASVHLARLPEPAELATGLPAEQAADWARLLEVRAGVLKALEQARNEKRIAGSLEAKVTLGADGPLGSLLERYRAWLPAVFIVSQVELDRGSDGVRVERAGGARCERCWNYSTRVGESPDYPTVCERCVEALEELGRGAGVAPGAQG
jgi:isoleucyl-tRNA synthetase